MILITEKDGGQAFPVPAGRVNDDGSAFYPTDGMTLRDYFAAGACNMLIRRKPLFDLMAIAKLAYEIADAMLVARNREKEL